MTDIKKDDHKQTITPRYYSVVSLFPDMFSAISDYGITSRAVTQKLVTLNLINPRAFSDSRYGQVDDKPYGGGNGMLLQVEPIRNAIQQGIKQSPSPPKVIYLSPHGSRLNQGWLMRLAVEPSLLLVCGRYEGLDQRIIDQDIDLELSLGDYVLSGGELAAMTLLDGIIRLLPNALGNETCAITDSFSDDEQGILLEHPHYTRPETVGEQAVPEVLLSGDHGKIKQWRQKQALYQTWLKRPDLFDQLNLTKQQRQWLSDWLEEAVHTLHTVDHESHN